MFKILSDASNSSCIEEEIIKEINTLNLTPHVRNGNIDCCKRGCECKRMATFLENFYLLLQIKSRSARGASRHSGFIGQLPG